MEHHQIAVTSLTPLDGVQALIRINNYTTKTKIKVQPYVAGVFAQKLADEFTLSEEPELHLHIHEYDGRVQDWIFTRGSAAVFLTAVGHAIGYTRVMLAVSNYLENTMKLSGENLKAAILSICKAVTQDSEGHGHSVDDSL